MDSTTPAVQPSSNAAGTSATAAATTAKEELTSAASSVSQTAAAAAAAAHNDITLALAKKESTEHMHGMKELYDVMRQQRLVVKAYALNDPKAPASSTCNNSNNIKTIHFVRHGQGFHNLMADQAIAAGKTWQQFCRPNDDSNNNNPYMMPELLDAPLTEKGRQQAILLQAQVAALEETETSSSCCTNNKLQLIVTSPNCRALQTSLLVFEQYLPHQQSVGGGGVGGGGGVIPFLAHELVREQHGIHVCDKRRSISRQCMEFPQVDFSLLLQENINEDVLFRDDVRESKLELGHRIHDFLTWLSQRPEHTIGIVSHSSWLLTLFNGVVDCSSSSSSSSSSCEDTSNSKDAGESSSSPSSYNALQEWFQTGEMRSVKLEFIIHDE